MTTNFLHTSAGVGENSSDFAKVGRVSARLGLVSTDIALASAKSGLVSTNSGAVCVSLLVLQGVVN